MRQLIIATQCAQNIGWLQARRSTGRTARDGQLLDRHDQGLTLDIVETDVQVMRHTLVEVTVEVDLLDLRQASPKAVPQHADAFVFRTHFKLGQSERFAHANNLVRRQGSRAKATLMASTMHLGLNTDTRLAADIKRTNTLGAVSLVGTERHQVHLELLQVDLDLASCLSGIHVENDVTLATNLANGLDILNDTDFIVDEHHGNQHRVRTQRSLEDLQVNQTVFLNIQVCHIKPVTLHFTTGIQHGLVLCLDGDDVLAALGIKAGSSLDGQVVGFGCARRPDDFAGVGVDKRRHVLARLLNCLLGLPTQSVAARSRIAEMLVEPRNHLVHYSRIHRRGRRVVEINGTRGHEKLLMLNCCVGSAQKQKKPSNRCGRRLLASNQAGRLSADHIHTHTSAVGLAGLLKLSHSLLVNQVLQ